MEDIIEEIVGEIHDEYDEELKDVEQTGEGSFLLNGRLSIFEFNERFGAGIADDAGYETIGGFLLKLAGRIPELNEVIPYKQMVFTIVRKSQRRIRMVKVKISSPS
jgi:putative hemolysin